jgi:hypothetical protein
VDDEKLGLAGAGCSEQKFMNSRQSKRGGAARFFQAIEE